MSSSLIKKSTSDPDLAFRELHRETQQSEAKMRQTEMQDYHTEWHQIEMHQDALLQHQHQAASHQAAAENHTYREMPVDATDFGLPKYTRLGAPKERSHTMPLPSDKSRDKKSRDDGHRSGSVADEVPAYPPKERKRKIIGIESMV